LIHTTRGAKQKREVWGRKKNRTEKKENKDLGGGGGAGEKETLSIRGRAPPLIEHAGNRDTRFKSWGGSECSEGGEEKIRSKGKQGSVK